MKLDINMLASAVENRILGKFYAGTVIAQDCSAFLLFTTKLLQDSS
jgi:hypothetical protein